MKTNHKTQQYIHKGFNTAGNLIALTGIGLIAYSVIQLILS